MIPFLDLSPIQQQLTEINNRYSLLGVRISDRQSEIDSMREEVRKHLDNLRNLGMFLDKVERQLPKDNVPQTRDEADKVIKLIKVCTGHLLCNIIWLWRVCSCHI